MACVLSLIAVGRPAAADLSVTGWELTSTARDGLSGAVAVTDTTVALPLNTSQQATHGLSAAGTAFDFTVAGDSALLGMQFDDHRGGAYGSFANNVGLIELTVDQDALYSITGQYALTGLRAVHLLTSLVETGGAAPRGVLFDNAQYSQATPDEVLTLGEVGGDYPVVSLNHLTGDLSGTLRAGYNYEFRYETFIHSYPSNAPGADLPAAGCGAVTLEVTPVPVPGGIGLGLLGLGMTVWRRHRGR